VDGELAAEQDAPVDVEQEMMDLADEQLRFLTTAKLLERTYASIRTAIKGTGA
jgi:flagellar basal body rod protein FlgB